MRESTYRIRQRTQLSFILLKFLERYDNATLVIWLNLPVNFQRIGHRDNPCRMFIIVKGRIERIESFCHFHDIVRMQKLRPTSEHKTFWSNLFKNLIVLLNCTFWLSGLVSKWHSCLGLSANARIISLL